MILGGWRGEREGGREKERVRVRENERERESESVRVRDREKWGGGGRKELIVKQSYARTIFTLLCAQASEHLFNIHTQTHTDTHTHEHKIETYTQPMTAYFSTSWIPHVVYKTAIAHVSTYMHTSGQSTQVQQSVLYKTAKCFTIFLTFGASATCM